MIFNRPAHIEELRIAYDFVEKILGSDVPSFEDVLALQQHNPSFINIVTDKERVTSINDIFGCYSFLPLTTEAHRAVQKNKLFGKDISVNHVASLEEPCDAIYIGVVAAVQRKGIVVTELFNALASHTIIGQTKLYTQPLTDDGKRLCKKYGFKPVDARNGQCGSRNYAYI